MAVLSTQVSIGTPAPDFTLPDLDAQSTSLADFAQHPILVVAFVCNHCPYVQHIETQLGEVAHTSPAAFVAICSNDASAYPQDDPAHLRQQVGRAAWSFPYLVDSDQAVAAAYGAVCTPDFFVYGPRRHLAYRGAFDGSTPKNGEPVDGALLRRSIELIADGQDVPLPHRPSMGCGIKWLPGKEPA